MNAIVPAQFGALPARFQGAQAPNDLSAGVQGGFGLIGYRGKVWSIRFRGEERQLMRADNDGPRGSIEVVILKASQHISKIWYEAGWQEGANAAPDCFSTNGVTPDIGAASPQSQTCAVCPKNAWGSRITPAGKQGKECSDSKRLAVVPLADLKNELFGGPMLLRVPAASLQEMANFANTMQGMGYPYYAIGVRISFDPAESFPKFKFDAIRVLSDEEADIVVALQNGPEVARILAESAEHTTGAPQPSQEKLAQTFEQPPQQPQQPQPPQQGASPNGGQPSAPQTAPATAATPQPQQTPPEAHPHAESGLGAMAPPQPTGQSPGTGTVSSTSAPTAEQPSSAPSAAPAVEPAAPDMEQTTQASSDGTVDGASSTPTSSAPANEAAPSGFEGDLDKQLDALLGGN